MRESNSKVNIAGVFRTLLIFAGIALLGFGIFTFFRIRTEAKAALREAKNIRMALQIADIDMYAREKTVYDPNDGNGLAEGVREMVESTAQPAGEYAITSYSYRRHEVTGLTYRTGNYYVVFKNNGSGISWDVTYLMRIYHFDEEDTKIVKK